MLRQSPIFGGMAFSQTELDALKAAYAKGLLSVSYNGRTMTYGSADDLWKRIRAIEAEINSTSTTRLKPRYQRAVFDD